MSSGRNWQRPGHRVQRSLKEQSAGVGRAAEQLQKHFSASEQLEIQSIVQVRSLDLEIKGLQVQTRPVKGENLPKYTKVFEALQIPVEVAKAENPKYSVLRLKNPDHWPQLFERLAAASDKFHNEVKGKSAGEYWHELSGEGKLNQSFRNFVDVLRRPSGDYLQMASGVRSKLAEAGIAVRRPAPSGYNV